MKNIGLTGIDNGKIKLDNINNEDIIKNSTLEFDVDDVRLTLTQVDSNTGNHEYPINLVDDENMGLVAELRGGFYQGFYKSGKEYEVLPFNGVNFTLEFILKNNPNEIVEETILNKTYPDNEGFFFYLGARAENKFKYNTLMGEIKEDEIPKNIEIDNLTTDNGISINDNNYKLIETDNKFLTYNRTKNGLKVSDKNSEKRVIKVISRNDDNKFLTYNRTKNGLKVSDKNAIVDDNEKLKDNINNQIGFRITNEGKIGYRLLSFSCDEYYEVNEEYTKYSVVEDNK